MRIRPLSCQLRYLELRSRQVLRHPMRVGFSPPIAACHRGSRTSDRSEAQGVIRERKRAAMTKFSSVSFRVLLSLPLLDGLDFIAVTVLR
jgi:hypothetical protein